MKICILLGTIQMVLKAIPRTVLRLYDSKKEKLASAVIIKDRTLLEVKEKSKVVRNHFDTLDNWASKHQTAQYITIDTDYRSYSRYLKMEQLDVYLTEIDVVVTPKSEEQGQEQHQDMSTAATQAGAPVNDLSGANAPLDLSGASAPTARDLSGAAAALSINRIASGTSHGPSNDIILEIDLPGAISDGHQRPPSQINQPFEFPVTPVVEVVRIRTGCCWN